VHCHVESTSNRWRIAGRIDESLAVHRFDVDSLHAPSSGGRNARREVGD
jgi:hypothetical protein